MHDGSPDAILREQLVPFQERMWARRVAEIRDLGGRQVLPILQSTICRERRREREASSLGLDGRREEAKDHLLGGLLHAAARSARMEGRPHRERLDDQIDHLGGGER